MCSGIILLALLPKSRLMTSYYVTCHVTTVTCLFIIKEKKEKEKSKKKRNIKLRKNKRKRKMLVSRYITTLE